MHSLVLTSDCSSGVDVSVRMQSFVVFVRWMVACYSMHLKVIIKQSLIE